MVCCILIVLASLIGVFGYRHIEPIECGDLLSSQTVADKGQVQGSQSTWDKVRNTANRYRRTILRRSVGFVVIIVAYNSLVMAFYTVTLETCIGNTFTYRKLIPLMGIVLGVAEIVGSVVFEKLGEKFSNKFLAMVLFAMSLTSFYFTFLIFRPESTSTIIELGDDSFLSPTLGIVLLIACLLGLSDAGYNILAASMMGLLFPSESEIGFMLLNSVLSLGTALTFFFSSQISLYTLLGITVTFCTLSTLFITLDLIKF